MTDERDPKKRTTENRPAGGQGSEQDHTVEEYEHVDPETVVEDAVEFFSVDAPRPPILDPDDPPPHERRTPGDGRDR
jgi:hypothetical protein